MKTDIAFTLMGLNQFLFNQSKAISPRFPGGREGLNQYLRETIAYPLQASIGWSEDSIKLHFVITEEGKMEQLTANGGPGPVCTEAVLRAFRNMPDWRPGMRDGRRVAMPVVMGIQCMLFFA